MKPFVTPTIVKRLSMIGCLLLIEVFLFVKARQHFGSFGCFDDCFNFMGAFFMLKGKILYSQIFFNHQMGMAYLSYLIQRFSPIHSLYQLIETHRIVIFLFGFLMDILLIIRFGFVGFAFALLYESTKFYLFGDRFLAESMIPYPLLYLFGLIWNKSTQKSLVTYDYLLSSLFAWFIIFMREPYIPLSLFLYACVLLQRKLSKPIFYSLFLFLSLSVLTLMTLPLPDYFFNVFTVNQQAQLISGDYSFIGLLKIFFYPIYIFFAGAFTILRIFEIILSTLFLSSCVVLLFLRKHQKFIIFSFIALGLANLRLVKPGTMYYEAFHQLIWYSLFLFTTILFLYELLLQTKQFRYYAISSTIGILLLLYAFFAPNSYIREKINSTDNFTTNYGSIYAYGKVLQDLAKPTDTLFLDGSDDMIYWQANLLSSYQYAWYTSVMPQFMQYTDARIRMFRGSPPDFYYGQCIHKTDSRYLLPSFVKKQYQQLYFSQKPSCLYIRSKKIAEISQQQWHAIHTLGYSLPSY